VAQPSHDFPLYGFAGGLNNSQRSTHFTVLASTVAFLWPEKSMSGRISSVCRVRHFSRFLRSGRGTADIVRPRFVLQESAPPFARFIDHRFFITYNCDRHHRHSPAPYPKMKTG